MIAKNQNAIRYLKLTTETFGIEDALDFEKRLHPCYYHYQELFKLCSNLNYDLNELSIKFLFI